MANMPTDEQIREFAKKIGALSPDGSCFTEPRNKLVAGAQKWLEELEAERGHAELDRPRTVDELKRLHAELLEAFDEHLHLPAICWSPWHQLLSEGKGCN